MIVLATRRMVLAAALMASVPWLCGTGALAEVKDTEQWVIEADQARSLLAAGALLLDTRGTAQRAFRSLPGSTPVTWQAFSNPDMPSKGQLLADDTVLTEQLRTLGVSTAVPVIAVADTANSWGEDGRIVWTLRTLGHQQAYLVNGGIEALLEGGDLPVTPAVIPGDFTIRRALLHKSRLRKDSPFPLHHQPTRTISAVPRAEKRFIRATRIWISAVWLSGCLAAMRSPKALRHRIFASIRLRTWYPVQRFQNALP